MKQLILSLCICCFGQFTFAQVVSSIDFEGATKTDTDYLMALIDSKVGEPFDSLTVKEDVQRLKNLNLFFSVDGEYKEENSGDYSIRFIIQEAVYLYPILSISGFDDQLKHQQEKERTRRL